MTSDSGFTSTPSRHSVDQTAERLEAMLREKGVKLFARIDHSGEARAAGLAMPPTKLLIFGNPKAGTPVMVASPTAAIDLPLKLLVWEDAEARVWITHNAATYLQARHGIPDALLQVLRAPEALAIKAGE